MALKYTKSNKHDLTISAYVDSNFANNINDRKSISGFILRLNDNSVFWKSKKQTIVALSSCEAEYVALSTCITECLFLKQLLENQALYIFKPILIYEDNQACIKMSNTLETKRSKHIDVRHHFVKDLVMEGNIKMIYVSSDCNYADLMTKSLSIVKFEFFRDSLNICRIEGVC